MEQSCSRREFFVGAAKVAAVAGIATILYSPVQAGEKAPAATSLTVDLSQEPNKPLGTVGGAVLVDNPNEKKSQIILYRKSETEVVAFTSKCTHVGGPVGLPDDKGVMTCKWHKAKFNIEGELVDGPAKKVLPKFVAKLEGNSVVVTL